MSFIESNQHEKDDIDSYIAIYLSKALAKKSISHEAKAYYHYCLVYRDRKEEIKAFEYINKAIDLAKQLNHHFYLGIFLHRKGTIFHVLGKNVEALDYYLQAYVYLKNEKKHIRNFLNLQYDIATIKLKAKHYDESLHLFKEIIVAYDSLIRKKPNIPSLKISYIHVLSGLAEAYTEEKQLYNAIKTYEKAIKISSENNYIFGEYLAKGGKGKALNHQKNYEKALLIIDEALDIANTDKNAKSIIPFLYAHKGESYIGLKEYKKAIRYLSKTDSIIKVDHLNFLELDHIPKLIARCYYNLGQYEKASQVFNEYVAKHELNNQERTRLRSLVFNNYDLRKVSDELENVNKEVSIFRNELYISYFIVFLLLGILSMIIVYHKRKQRNNKLKFEALLQEITIREQEQKNSKTNFIISDDTSKSILDQLAHFEASKLYLDRKYNLATLAKKFNTNSSYLSKVINMYKEKTFSKYLIDLRINHILIELKNNTKIRSYTIQAIAEEAGFNKAESFSKAFKQRTGFNPSFYLKNLDKM